MINRFSVLRNWLLLYFLFCIPALTASCSILFYQPPTPYPTPTIDPNPTLRNIFPTEENTPSPTNTATPTAAATETRTIAPTAALSATPSPTATPVPAQASVDASSWAIAYGTDQNENAYAAFETSDADYLIAGKTGTNTNWLMRIDSTGKILWQKSFIFAVASIYENRNGEFILFSPQSITKITALGEVLWAKTYLTDQALGGRELSLDTVEVIAEAGDGAITLRSSLIEATLLPGGNLENIRYYPPTQFTFPREATYTNAVSRAGKSLYIGTHQMDGSDFLIAKTTTDGSWERNFNLRQDGGPHVWPPVFIELLENDDILAGVTIRHFSGDASMDLWVVRLSPNGEVLWQQIIGPQAVFGNLVIKELSNGDILFAGNHIRFGGDPSPAHLIWLIRLDADGELIWDRLYEASAAAEIFSITELMNGSIMLTGQTDTYGAGATDAWVMKLTTSGEIPGCVLQTGSGEARTLAPAPISSLNLLEDRIESYSIFSTTDDSPGAGIFDPLSAAAVICGR